jgi:hypothetical protein
MADADTNPIPREELRDLIDITRVDDDHERRTVQMEPIQLEKLLLPERTTADLVVKLEKRKQQLNLMRLMAISVLSGVWLGLAALVAIAALYA